MQTNKNLDREGLAKLVESIFESGHPEVYLRISALNEEGEDFASAREINAYIDAAIQANKKFIAFSIWYPDTRGHVEKRSVSKDITKSEGHLDRHAITGWGIILLQLNFENPPLINCCISCSSRNKAKTWSGGHPDLRNPDLWDWEAVERYCGHLMRLAEKLEGKMVRLGGPPDL